MMPKTESDEWVDEKSTPASRARGAKQRIIWRAMLKNVLELSTTAEKCALLGEGCPSVCLSLFSHVSQHKPPYRRLQVGRVVSGGDPVRNAADGAGVISLLGDSVL